MIRLLAMVAFVASPLLAGTAEEDYQALLVAFKAGRHAEALTKAEAFITDHPDYKYAGAAHYIGGRSANHEAEYERAEIILRAMLERHPDNRHIDKARNLLVDALDGARKLEECIEQCKANLEAAPESSYAERWGFLIGGMHFRLWQFEEAETELKRFQESNPDSHYYNRAQAYLNHINPDIDADENGVVAGYDGKFKEDVRFQRALNNLPRYVEDAWKILNETLGVDLAGAPVVFEFRDTGYTRSAYFAVTETIAIDYKPFARMTFYTEYIVVSEEDFRSRVIHELKHAAFRDVMGQGYLDLPKWVREGLAVYGARQFEDRLPAIVSNYVFSGREPRDVLDGIDDADRSTNDYLEDCAAFLWLEKQRKGAVHEFCRRLVRGEDWAALFAELGGAELSECLEAAAVYARELVESRLGSAEGEYLKIRDDEFTSGRDDTHVEWMREEGIDRYAAWFKANPDHPLAPNCRYRLGKALILTDSYDDGREHMREVIRLYQLRSSICDDAMFWIAHSHQLQENDEKAAESFGVLLRDYSWSRQAIANRDKFTPAGPVLEEEE